MRPRLLFVVVDCCDDFIGTDLTFEGIATLYHPRNLWLRRRYYRNRPDIRRDCDTLLARNRIHYPLLEIGTDLTFEGIATPMPFNNRFKAAIGTDLTFEGIATQGSKFIAACSRPDRNRPDIRRDCDMATFFLVVVYCSDNIGTDLTFEGIATYRLSINLSWYTGNIGTDLTFEGIATQGIPCLFYPILCLSEQT